MMNTTLGTVVLLLCCVGCKRDSGSTNSAATTTSAPSQPREAELRAFLSMEERALRRDELAGTLDERQRAIWSNERALRQRLDSEGFSAVAGQPWVVGASLLHEGEEGDHLDRIGLSVYMFGSYPAELLIYDGDSPSRKEIGRISLQNHWDRWRRTGPNKAGLANVTAWVRPSQLCVCERPRPRDTQPSDGPGSTELKWDPWTQSVTCAVRDERGELSNSVPLFIQPAAGKPEVISGSVGSAPGPDR